MGTVNRYRTRASTCDMSVTEGFIAVERMVHDMKVSSEDQFKSIIVQSTEVQLLFLQTFLLQKISEQLLDAIQISVLEKVQGFGGNVQNPADAFVVKKKMDSIHTLSQKKLYGINVRIADA
jgi:hypothetical protein